MGYGALIGSFTAQLSCPCVELGRCLQQEPLALLWLQMRPVLAQVDEELEGMVRADRFGGDPYRPLRASWMRWRAVSMMVGSMSALARSS